MLALPAKLSPQIAALGSDQAKIFDALKAGIDEAMEEISDYRNALSEIEESDDGKEDTD